MSRQLLEDAWGMLERSGGGTISYYLKDFRLGFEYDQGVGNNPLTLVYHLNAPGGYIMALLSMSKVQGAWFIDRIQIPNQ